MHSVMGGWRSYLGSYGLEGHTLDLPLASAEPFYTRIHMAKETCPGRKQNFLAKKP